MATQATTVSNLFMGQDFATPSLLFIFGALLSLGVLGAILAHKIKFLPSITAFMLLGFAIGPHALGLMKPELLRQSDVLIDIALGLILYKLGSEVQLRHLLRSTSLWRVSLTEAFLTFVMVLCPLFLFHTDFLPSALIAAIALSSSPAVLVHMAEETESRGPVIYRAKALLTLNNILCFFAFSLLLPFALGETAFNALDMIGIPLYRAAGACAVGLAAAGAATLINRLIDREDEHFRFALIIGTLTITLGLASMLKVSSLFASLTLGVAMRWIDRERQGLSSVDIGPGADTFTIVLFVMAGASLHFDHIAAVGPITLAVAATRWLGKWIAVFLNGVEPNETLKKATALSFMLLPMGALAIGLARTLYGFSPELGAKVLPVVFTMIALLETLGPFAVSLALRMTGESALYRAETARATAETPVEAAELPKIEQPTPGSV